MKKAYVFIILVFITSFVFAETIKPKAGEESELFAQTAEPMVNQINNAALDEADIADGKEDDKIEETKAVPEEPQSFELKTGKVFSGKVISQNEKKIVLETAAGRVSIPRKMLASEEDKQRRRKSVNERASGRRTARSFPIPSVGTQGEQEAKGPSIRPLFGKAKERDIQFFAVSLYDGMDGSSYGFNQKVFNAMQARAKKVDLDLSKVLDEKCVYKQLNGTFFIVFYNLVQATGCDRQYLIQRVLLEKKESGGAGGMRSKKEYLVEVMKLNKFGFIKRADEHYKTYSLNSASKRSTTGTIEIGCGEIPGVIEGRKWPFSPGILYEKVQGYSEQPGLYNKIDFDFSNTLRFTFKFGKRGRPEVNVPGYTCREL